MSNGAPSTQSILHLTMSTTNDSEAAAANFIRDLSYNPVLRTKFFEALNEPNDSFIEQAIDSLLNENGYKCKHTDLSNGYKNLLGRSLLAWQSMYEVSPIADVADPKKNEGSMHRITVLGSRTNNLMIFFDAKVVVGVQNKFHENGTLNWEAATSSCPMNGRLAFTFDVSSAPQDAKHLGTRILKAKLWKQGESEPTDFTHQGRDWFDDIGKFNGTYYTILENNKGNISAGLPVSLNVRQDLVTVGGTTAIAEALVDVSITRENTVIPLGTSLKASQNTVEWRAGKNNEKDFTSKDVKPWRQGYLSFSWQYVPEVLTSSQTGVPQAKLRKKAFGSIWVDDVQEYTHVECDFVSESTPKDISYELAKFLGYGTSLGLILLTGACIYSCVKDLVVRIKKLKAKAGGSTKPDPKKNLEMSRAEALKKAIPPNLNGIDFGDVTSWERVRDKAGNQRKNSNGDNLYKHPFSDEFVIAEKRLGDKVSFKIEDLPGGKNKLADLEKSTKPIDFFLPKDFQRPGQVFKPGDYLSIREIRGIPITRERFYTMSTGIVQVEAPMPRF